MNWSIFLFVFLATSANVLGGLLFVSKKNWSVRGLHALMALSAGLLMSIAILDFIPDALERESSSPVFWACLLFTFFNNLWRDISTLARKLMSMPTSKVRQLEPWRECLFIHFLTGYRLPLALRLTRVWALPCFWRYSFIKSRTV